MAKKKRPENLQHNELRREAQRLYANCHSQRAFIQGCEHVLDVLGYNSNWEEV